MNKANTKNSASGCCLDFVQFSANSSLMLLIKMLLIETLLIKKRVFATNLWTAAAHIPGNSSREAHLYSRKLDSANE